MPCHQKIIVITLLYSLSRLGQDIAKGSSGLRVKLPPAHLYSVYHSRWSLYNVPLIAERLAGKLKFYSTWLTDPGIER